MVDAGRGTRGGRRAPTGAGRRCGRAAPRRAGERVGEEALGGELRAAAIAARHADPADVELAGHARPAPVRRRRRGRRSGCWRSGGRWRWAASPSSIRMPMTRWSSRSDRRGSTATSPLPSEPIGQRAGHRLAAARASSAPACPTIRPRGAAARWPGSPGDTSCRPLRASRSGVAPSAASSRLDELQSGADRERHAAARAVAMSKDRVVTARSPSSVAKPGSLRIDREEVRDARRGDLHALGLAGRARGVDHIGEVRRGRVALEGGVALGVDRGSVGLQVEDAGIVAGEPVARCLVGDDDRRRATSIMKARRSAG